MCKCAARVDGHLKGRNYTMVRNILEGDSAPAIVEITKIESKKRSPSMSLVATFCPFCGKKYPKRKSRGILRNGPSNRAAHG